jgi:hypothetical protein
MTVFEMQQLFETLLQTQSPLYNDSDKPDTDTILRYLNHAQTSYIKEKYLSAPTFIDRTIALGNSVLDLGTLIVNNDLNVSASSLYTYSNTADYTSDYWHIIKIVGKITRSKPYSISKTQVQLKPINIENIDRFLTTANNIPIILTPVFTTFTLSGGTEQHIVIVYDKYTTYSITAGDTNMVYLKKPKSLDLTTSNTTLTTTCELAPYLHNELVKYAVELFEQEKYKLASKKQDKEK